MAPQKKDLRKHFLEQRSSISEQSRLLNDAQIRRHLTQLIKQKKITSVFLFHPFRGEPDVWSLVGSLKNMVVALPVMDPKSNSTMVFVRVTEKTVVVANRFGILEPEYADGLTVQPSPETLVVVPALAVDHAGVRLGYGGGYYDRYFGALESRTRPVLVAALYRESYVATLPQEAHDLRVDYVVTEEGCFEMPGVKKTPSA
jgi:5-formyltetrahydrofolate cyclo-ligase